MRYRELEVDTDDRPAAQPLSGRFAMKTARGRSPHTDAAEQPALANAVSCPTLFGAGSHKPVFVGVDNRLHPVAQAEL